MGRTGFIIGGIIGAIPVLLWAFGSGAPSFFPMAWINLADSCIGEGWSAFSCSWIWIPYIFVPAIIGGMISKK